jgi:hypothetical protein
MQLDANHRTLLQNVIDSLFHDRVAGFSSNPLSAVSIERDMLSRASLLVLLCIACISARVNALDKILFLVGGDLVRIQSFLMITCLSISDDPFR